MLQQKLSVLKMSGMMVALTAAYYAPAVFLMAAGVTQDGAAGAPVKLLGWLLIILSAFFVGRGFRWFWRDAPPTTLDIAAVVGWYVSTTMMHSDGSVAGLIISATFGLLGAMLFVFGLRGRHWWRAASFA